jgi:hypothetical protein
MDDTYGDSMILIDHRIREEILTAVGKAAMCWSSGPAGLFDTRKAVAIAEEATEKIMQIVKHAA